MSSSSFTAFSTSVIGGHLDEIVIDGAAGVDAEDLTASEVTLVTILVDASSSIASRGLTDAVVHVELESVEVLEDAASWPMDFNIDAYIDDFGKRSPHSALNWQIELLVDPILVHHWDRRMVKKSITVGELDAGSGRVHVTIDEEPNHELIEWLWGYAALLEVRSPAHLREQFVERARNAARAYADDPDPVSTMLAV